MMKTLLSLYQPVLAGEWLADRRPVLSVRSTQPAACSTLPRLRCSPAGLLMRMLLLLLLLELQLLSPERSHLPELRGGQERQGPAHHKGHVIVFRMQN